jgi:hypothetical protein
VGDSDEADGAAAGADTSADGAAASAGEHASGDTAAAAAGAGAGAAAAAAGADGSSSPGEAALLRVLEALQKQMQRLIAQEERRSLDLVRLKAKVCMHGACGLWCVAAVPAG